LLPVRLITTPDARARCVGLEGAVGDIALQFPGLERVREVFQQAVTQVTHPVHGLGFHCVLRPAFRLMIDELFDNLLARIESIAREIASEAVELEQREKKQWCLGKTRNTRTRLQGFDKALGAVLCLRLDRCGGRLSTKLLPLQNTVPQQCQQPTLRFRQRRDTRSLPGTTDAAQGLETVRP
jgi:hypothetical protein